MEKNTKYTIKALAEMRKRTENEKQSQKPKLGVFGSRTLFGDEVVAEIIEAIKDFGAGTIVTTQEPRGVCTVAQNVAKRLAMPLELHFVNPERYARGMHSKRSAEVVAQSDCFVIIHDGVSKGTINEHEQCKKSGKPIKYVVLDPDTLAHHNDGKLDAFAAANDLNQELDAFMDGFGFE